MRQKGAVVNWLHGVSQDYHYRASYFANANGTRLNYLIAGPGDPVVLLHGYAETSHSTKAEMARDIHAHARKLGYERLHLAVSRRSDRIVLMDAASR
ncbi:MAG TPA: hypothetical protein VLM42_16300 [Bryobacteraceae bacterium]|nr:hypothetical protein [Bryobacteraceae bacterium]